MAELCMSRGFKKSTKSNSKVLNIHYSFYSQHINHINLHVIWTFAQYYVLFFICTKKYSIHSLFLLTLYLCKMLLVYILCLIDSRYTNVFTCWRHIFFTSPLPLSFVQFYFLLWLHQNVRNFCLAAAHTDHCAFGAKMLLQLWQSSDCLRCRHSNGGVTLRSFFGKKSLFFFQINEILLQKQWNLFLHTPEFRLLEVLRDPL